MVDRSLLVGAREQRRRLRLLAICLAAFALAGLARHYAAAERRTMAPAAKQTAGASQQQPGASYRCTGASAFQAPAHPSQESFLRIKADASLVDKEPALLAEFEAAPWLLPPRIQALPYAGVHDLDALLALRARTVGGHNKVVALVQFSKRFALMLQNCIYSMVKFGQVRGTYLVLTWTPDDLAACAELNLPCANVSSFLPGKLTGKGVPQHGKKAGEPGTEDYNTMMWLRPAVVLHCLEKGHTVMFSDADIAYANKPLLESMLAVMDANGAEGVIQVEEPVNTGAYCLKPTPAVLHIFRGLAARTPTALKKGWKEQDAFAELLGKEFVFCKSQKECLGKRGDLAKSGKEQPPALFRTFLPAQYFVVGHHCGLGNGLRDATLFPNVDPCDSTALFVHAVCLPSTTQKQKALQGIGWFYLEEDKRYCAPRKNSPTGVPICQPRQWRQPQAEQHQYDCRQRPWLGHAPQAALQ